MEKKLNVSMLLIGLLACSLPVTAQVFKEKQTRHRFAQLNLGIDFETSIGGESTYLNLDNNESNLRLENLIRPRFIIGGTHFWGHADFYLAIPFTSPVTQIENQNIQHLRGVEIALKYYPIQIEHGTFRPYFGISVSPFYFEQSNNNLNYSSGPELYYTSYPLLSGVTYNHKKHLLEFGIAWNYESERRYFISREIQSVIRTPPVYLNISYRLMLETTLSAEQDWESGETQKVTKSRSQNGGLNGFFVGVGLSSAFWLGESSYNKKQRPFMEKYGISIMPDFSLGYYLHTPDLNINLAYRPYRTSSNTYGVIQRAERQSLAFEITKYLFDYYGFDPFIGPVISYENLAFKESFEGLATINISEKKVSYGITFGWDIRPNRIQSIILRTSLRWYPSLDLSTEGDQKISFDNLEFNFIQVIGYLNRF